MSADSRSHVDDAGDSGPPGSGGAPRLGEASGHGSRLPLDPEPLDRATSRELQAVQGDILELLAAADAEPTAGRSSRTCRSDSR